MESQQPIFEKIVDRFKELVNNKNDVNNSGSWYQDWKIARVKESLENEGKRSENDDKHFIERVLRRAMRRQNAHIFRGIVGYCIDQYRQAIIDENNLDKKAEVDVSFYWNSISLGRWFRISSCGNYANGDCTFNKVSANRILNDWIFDKIPVDFHPGINVDAAIEGLRLQCACRLTLKSVGNSIEGILDTIPKNEKKREIQDFNSLVLKKITPEHLLNSEELNKTAQIEQLIKIYNLFKSNVEDINNKKHANKVAEINEDEKIKRGRGWMLSLYHIFLAAIKPHCADKWNCQVVLIPLVDDQNHDLVHGMLEIAVIPLIPKIDPITDNNLLKIVDEGKLFAATLRKIELSALAGQYESPARAVDAADIETLIREVMTPIDRYLYLTNNKKELPAPPEIKYNYALREVLEHLESNQAYKFKGIQWPKATASPIVWKNSSNKFYKLWNEKHGKGYFKNRFQLDPPDCLNIFSGASPHYIHFLRSLFHDVEKNPKLSKPFIIFLHSEPGCGKEYLSQFINLIHMANVLYKVKNKIDHKCEDHACSLKSFSRNGLSLKQGDPIFDLLSNQKRKATNIKAKGNKKLTKFLNAFQLASLGYQVVQMGEVPKDMEGMKKHLFGSSMENPGPYTLAGLLHGTIFLDEFNTMADPKLADIFLRIFDPGEVELFEKEPENGEKSIKKRYKLAPLVVIGSNVPKENLSELKFNQAVINRITQHSYVIPPLRERKEDIVMILSSLLNKDWNKVTSGDSSDETTDKRGNLSKEELKIEKDKRKEMYSRPGIDAHALRMLVEMPWLDNIRGLQGFVDDLIKNRVMHHNYWPDIEFEEVAEVISDRIFRVEERGLLNNHKKS